jgi:hypothetical protein
VCVFSPQQGFTVRFFAFQIIGYYHLLIKIRQ